MTGVSFDSSQLLHSSGLVHDGRRLHVWMADGLLRCPSDLLKSLCISPLDVAVVQQDVPNNRPVEKEQNVLVDKDGPQLPEKMEPLVCLFAASIYVCCPVDFVVDDGAKILARLNDFYRLAFDYKRLNEVLLSPVVNYDLLRF